ncbi:MAG TPA: tRNA (adenosine(37)-N6)-dimethylallyltransferase MiaA [Caulobacteraceae bacterium]|nr:tRNA (adenosine(37)-N6)-dimethylallyltransferase MiaA [Caulobacteraceae bacterium]
MAPAIWLIAGPTASGKSALALRLAEQIGGEIVNADALQLYRDLRVLTARPSADEEARAPHHLFGVADAADGWSVGRWLRAARDVLARASAPLIFVGGTGLYFKALSEGLAEIPPVPEPVRRAVEAWFDAGGEAAFREALAKDDPAAERRIAPGDRQRLVRAMEVYEATGKALSDWQAQTSGAISDFNAVVLEPPRDALYARCDARLLQMAQQGALDEVRALTERRLSPSLPAMKAVGVREFASHLRGETTLPEAIAAAQRETRRYAKRQMTWLRNQTPKWPRLTATDASEQWRQFLALNPSLTLVE